MKSFLIKIFIGLIFVLSLNFSFGQTVVNLPVIKDSYIQSNVANNNNTTLMTSGTSQTRTYKGGPPSVQYYQRVFVEFDLTSIPVDAIICSAEINLEKKYGVYGSNPWRTKLVTSLWNETTIKSTLQPSISNLSNDVSTISSISGNTVSFDVASMVQRMVNGQITNFGWSIQVLDETISSKTGATFYTKENSVLKPKLAISYYLPLSVSSALVSHESGVGQNDGSITPTITGGTGSFTYEWIDGSTGTVLSTSSSVSGLSYGWYGLHITGTCNDELYQGFLVGTDCEAVDIEFITDENYTDNAYVTNKVYVDKWYNFTYYEDNNYGNSTIMKAADAYLSTAYGVTFNGIHYNYLKYNLWMDPALTVTKADLKLFGRYHKNFGNNATQFNKVTSTWNENAITYNNQPNSSNSILELVSATATSTENKTVDIIDFWEDWKTDNTLNYGMKLGMQAYNNIDAWQDYHSPTSSTTLRRPVIEFTLDLRHSDTPLFCRPELLPYNVLKRKLDGGYAYAYEHTIKFTFDEEYELDNGKYLAINLYDENWEVIANCDASGNTTGGMAAFYFVFDDNRFTLDLSPISGLTVGDFYTIEVFTSKGEKRYLKFLYKN